MAAAETLYFNIMSEAQMRQWVEANPGRVNDRDGNGLTPLAAAAMNHFKLSLVVWLLDEKGAGMNATSADERSALHFAASADNLIALSGRGADPMLADDYYGALPLMWSFLWNRQYCGTPAARLARPSHHPHAR